MTIACLATIKERKNLLPMVVESLRHQVDFLYVMCNDYKHDKSYYSNVFYTNISEGFIDRGDSNKFLIYTQMINRKNFVWFFCDDDLLYPRNYVSVSLNHLRRYSKSILSYHGRTIKPRPLDSYYRFSRLSGYRCLDNVYRYIRVDPNGTLGSGVMFFNSGIEFNIEEFKNNNMADIYLAKFAIRDRYPMRVCPHPAGWIKDLHPLGGIFEKHQYDDTIHTELYNSIK